MKASEIILSSFIFKDKQRGEALEILSDLILEYYGPNYSQKSNGLPIDAILILLDRLIDEDNNTQQLGFIASIEHLKEDYNHEST